MLTVEEVALREMRDRGRGWVWGQWYVFLAGGLGGKSSWVEKIAGGEESEQVRVVEARLESQRMVVMDKQRFFFFDTDGVEPFRDVRDVAACL